MNYLLAKVNDRKRKYRKALSLEEPIYGEQGVDKGIEYTPVYKLEEDEWFVISSFSEKEYCIDLLKEDFDSTKFQLLNKDEPEKISFLCAYQRGNEFCFQRVRPSSLLQRKRFLGIGDEITIKTIKHGVALQDVPDAIYNKDQNCLYFKKLEVISPIFRGIQELYRIATDEEVEGFLKEEFIQVAEGYGTHKIGKANRQRLAMAVDTLSGLDKEQKKKIFTYTEEYYPQLVFEDGAFNIGTEEELKYLFWGIEQRYYTTPVTGEKRVANSVMNMDLN